MKVNFKKLRVEVSFGDFKELDVAEAVGNFIHSVTSDIGLDDIAREIYYSTGEIELSEKHANLIICLIEDDRCSLIAAIKKAIIIKLKEC